MSRTHGVTELTDPKRGDPVWMVINGEPALRYFVQFYSSGCQIAFDETLKQTIYHDLNLFFKSRADVLTFLIAGLLSNLDDTREQLNRRCAELCAAASDMPETESEG